MTIAPAIIIGSVALFLLLAMAVGGFVCALIRGSKAVDPDLPGDEL